MTRAQIGKALKNARLNAGLTQKQAAAALGRTQQVVGHWETGYSQPDANTLFDICELYGVTVDQAFGTLRQGAQSSPFMSVVYSSGEIQSLYRALDHHGKKAVSGLVRAELERMEADSADRAAPMRRLKYYESPVSAGTGEYLDNAYNKTIEVPLTPETKQADFVVRVSGDSMEPDFFDGDELLVEATPAIDENELGIFIVNDEGLFKKQGIGRLISLNNNYADIILHDYDSVYCRGRVIGKL